MEEEEDYSPILFKVLDVWHHDPCAKDNGLGSIVEVSFASPVPDERPSNSRYPPHNEDDSSSESDDSIDVSSTSSNSSEDSSSSSSSSSSPSSSSGTKSPIRVYPNPGISEIEVIKRESVDSGFSRTASGGDESEEEGLLSDDSSDWENYKPYQKPFISSNTDENFDNNNPGWNYLRNLSTDEDRYKVVRDAWKNPTVPNPNKNLSVFCSTFRFCSQDMRTNSRKRKRVDWNVGPTPKRAKLENLGFYKSAVEHAQETVTDDFEADMRKPHKNDLQYRYKEKLSQLEDTIAEVSAFHGFYHGLTGHETTDQSSIEHEQVDIDNLYRSFCYYYNWDYRFFNHPNISSF